MSPRASNDKNSFFRPSRSRFRSRRAISAATLVATYEELLYALSEQRVQITLDADIVVKQNILINYDVAINFNGHSIISDETRIDARVLDIRRGEVTLTGEGRIFAMGKDSTAIRIFGAISTGVSDYSKLIVDEKIHLYAPDGHGILVAPNLGAAYAASVRFAGEIIAKNGISVSSGVRGTDGSLPEITVKSGAEIIADDASGAALDGSGIANWHIDSAKLLGANGLHLCAGKFTFNNTQIISGSATFLIDAEPTAENLQVTIDGGSYFSESHLVFSGTPRTRETFIIKNGNFCGKWGIVTADLVKSINALRANFVTDVDEFTDLLVPESAPAEVAPLVIEQPDPAPAIVESTFMPLPVLPEPEKAPEAPVLPPAPAQVTPELNELPLRPAPTFRTFTAPAVKPFKPISRPAATPRLNPVAHRPEPIYRQDFSLPTNTNFEEISEPEEDLILPTVAPSRHTESGHHLVSLSDLELDQLFDIDSDINRLVREYWSARPILIDESAPVHFSASALRKCKVKHMRQPKLRNESIAKSLFAGFQAGFNVFRETRASVKI